MASLSEFDLNSDVPVIDIPRTYNAAVDFIDRNLIEPRSKNIAVIDQTGSFTYADLSERVNRAGNALINLGLKPEDRVAMIMLDTVDFPSVFWGCIKAGLVPIPLNTLLTSSDYRYILNDCRAGTLIVSNPLLEKITAIRDELPFLEYIIVSGSSQGESSLADLVRQADPELDTAPTTCDDVAFWLYSSGSTGTPKGVIHCHSHLLHTAVLYGLGILGIQQNDVLFSAAKLFFAYGLGNGMSFPFLAGATAILLSDRPSPGNVMDTIRAHQPTVFFGVPSLYAGLLADPSIRPESGSLRLRACVSAGEALPEEIGQRCEQWFGAPVLDGIGSTEMLHIFISNSQDDVRYGTSGKPVPGYKVKLVDEQDHPVGINEIGELAVNGPSAAMAYWNQRDKSLHTFRGEWTYTGDKYMVDRDGYYLYCGRTDDMLKVSGQWVSPFEVESTIIQHDQVMEAAVVGQQDENDLVKPKAYVVIKPGIEGSEQLAAEIQEFVKARIARHKYPRWIEFVDSMPKTATGKIQRFKLRNK